MLLFEGEKESSVEIGFNEIHNIQNNREILCSFLFSHNNPLRKCSLPFLFKFLYEFSLEFRIIRK